MPAKSERSFHPALREYIEGLNSLAPQSTPSVFWERQLENFQAAYAQIEEFNDDELDRLVHQRSYGFVDLPAGIDSPADDPYYRDALAALDRARKFSGKLTPNGVGVDKGQFEHLRSLDFLARLDLSEAYLELIQPLGVRSSMSVARHWYYARNIVELIRSVYGEPRPLDV